MVAGASIAALVTKPFPVRGWDSDVARALAELLGLTEPPTVLVLDSAGRIVKRASGAPRKADVLAVLGEIV